MTSLLCDSILLGDCVGRMDELASGSVDFVLTDPPYLVNYRSRSGERVANDDNDARLAPAFAQIGRVLKPDSFCVSFYGWNSADRFIGMELETRHHQTACKRLRCA